ncbi:hypothetical protein QVD17_20030 [Tagetes erecta]|uniref:Uncharacterized protein n=1 Tax=Tagetes erecta TaxID=13708 RepID=A0AAD8NQM8_TARER|nr:hypothetical protein QVD17_20030 [Tagetes erecta]
MCETQNLHSVSSRLHKSSASHHCFRRRMISLRSNGRVVAVTATTAITVITINDVATMVAAANAVANPSVYANAQVRTVDQATLNVVQNANAFTNNIVKVTSTPLVLPTQLTM